MKDSFNQIQMTVSGIRCDNKTCDYLDEDVTLDQFPEYINKPCPKCGENLLTQEDYDNTVAMLDLVKTLDAGLEHVNTKNTIKPITPTYFEAELEKIDGKYVIGDLKQSTKDNNYETNNL